MDVAKKIHLKLEKILNRLKVLKVIQTYKLEINFCQFEENLKTNLNEIDSILKKCLKKIITKPRKAEIRNVLTELLRKKNLSNVQFDSENITLDKDNPSPINVTLLRECSGSQEDKVLLDFNCEVCGQKFELKKNLIIHKKIHKEIREYLCELCGKTYHSDFRWKSHNQKHSNELKTVCKLNNKFVSPITNSFKDNSSDRKQVYDYLRCLPEIQLKENSVTCSFYSKNVLGRLVTEDNKKGLLKNYSMENGFSSTQEAKFTCECGKVFRLLKTFKKHMNLKHSTKNKIYNCIICDRSFKERGKLNRHMLIHKVSQYECSLCMKKFVRSDALKRHLFIAHYPKKNYSCCFCSKKFNLKYNKDVHERNIHKRVSSCIQCDQCGQKFRNKITFKSHLKIHSDKPITCKICRKAFIRKIHYKSHMRNKHFGVSLYQSLLDSVTADESVLIKN